MDTLMLRFLYRTIPGRMILKILVHPLVSAWAGQFFSCGASKFLVPYYVKKHHIDMKNAVVPAGGFSSFNDFFTRKRTAGEIHVKEGDVISPCDGFLTPVEIEGGRVFDIKNAEYTLEDLLKSRKLGEKFKEGMAFVFRLTPANYHRYCYSVSGNVTASRRIEGILHCVRPVALRTFPVFAQNSREYQVISTDNFGTVVQMEIGALLVGKIKNHSVYGKTKKAAAGKEKGYFEFGGSTIVLLFQKDAVRMEEELYRRLDDNGEIPVHMGEVVAQRK